MCGVCAEWRILLVVFVMSWFSMESSPLHANARVRCANTLMRCSVCHRAVQRPRIDPTYIRYKWLNYLSAHATDPLSAPAAKNRVRNAQGVPKRRPLHAPTAVGGTAMTTP